MGCLLDWLDVCARKSVEVRLGSAFFVALVINHGKLRAY